MVAQKNPQAIDENGRHYYMDMNKLKSKRKNKGYSDRTNILEGEDGFSM
jgi:hypothetical protein